MSLPAPLGRGRDVVRTEDPVHRYTANPPQHHCPATNSIQPRRATLRSETCAPVGLSITDDTNTGQAEPSGVPGQIVSRRYGTYGPIAARLSYVGVW